jgi:hypothetical protein
MRILRTGLLLGVVLAAGGAQAKVEKKQEDTFYRNGHIHGHLVDPAGQGLTGIVVLCTPDGRRIASYETNSYRRGRFDIDNLLPGSYRLHVDTVGAVVSDLAPPDDRVVEVRNGEVSRPRLTAK